MLETNLGSPFGKSGGCKRQNEKFHFLTFGAKENEWHFIQVTRQKSSYKRYMNWLFYFSYAIDRPLINTYILDTYILNMYILMNTYCT